MRKFLNSVIDRFFELVVDNTSADYPELKGKLFIGAPITPNKSSD